MKGPTFTGTPREQTLQILNLAGAPHQRLDEQALYVQMAQVTALLAIAEAINRVAHRP